MSHLPRARLHRYAAGDPAADEERVVFLVELAHRGMRQMFDPDHVGFPWTLRGIATEHGPAVRREGLELMYDGISALGVARLSTDDQRAVLGGITVHEFVSEMCERAATHPHLGAVALVAWAAAEISGRHEAGLFDRWDRALASGQGLETVYVAWALTAAVAAAELGPTGPVRDAARDLLLAGQGPSGLWPKYAPAHSGPAWRRHVGCFADQVYPIQALARHHGHRPDSAALDAANACAARICELQGTAGEWWWHYDRRTGAVVEPFPVYSVHQHSMAPMALMELWEAGGADHRRAIGKGLSWLTTHPEIFVELVDPRWNVIWRRVGRREPRRLARGLKAVGTSALPGRNLPSLDRLLPPTAVDYECRPYELGWLLYVWLSDPVLATWRSEHTELSDPLLPTAGGDPGRGGPAEPAQPAHTDLADPQE